MPTCPGFGIQITIWVISGIFLPVFLFLIGWLKLGDLDQRPDFLAIGVIVFVGTLAVLWIPFIVEELLLPQIYNVFQLYPDCSGINLNQDVRKLVSLIGTLLVMLLPLFGYLAGLDRLEERFSE